MKGIFKSLAVALRLSLRKPFTFEYPEKGHQPIAPRYMSFPGLTWDHDVGEPYCTGCLVCARICPTDCITVSMRDNPKHSTGESSRRKIVEDFHLNMANCIICELCVRVCNFDAILMTDYHEEASQDRSDLVADLPRLLQMGKAMQAQGRFNPTKREARAERRAATRQTMTKPDETDEQTEQLTTEPESPNGDAPVGDGEGEG